MFVEEEEEAHNYYYVTDTHKRHFIFSFFMMICITKGVVGGSLRLWYTPSLYRERGGGLYNVSCIVMSKENRNFPLFFILCDKKGMIIVWGIISLYSKKRVFNPELFARNSFIFKSLFSSAVAELSDRNSRLPFRSGDWGHSRCLTRCLLW